MRAVTWLTRDAEEAPGCRLRRHGPVVFCSGFVPGASSGDSVLLLPAPSAEGHTSGECPPSRSQRFDLVWVVSGERPLRALQRFDLVWVVLVCGGDWPGGRVVCPLSRSHLSGLGCGLVGQCRGASSQGSGPFALFCAGPCVGRPLCLGRLRPRPADPDSAWRRAAPLVDHLGFISAGAHDAFGPGPVRRSRRIAAAAAAAAAA